MIGYLILKREVIGFILTRNYYPSGKTYFKYILAPTALAIALTGCFDLASPGSDTDESIQATVNEAKARKTQEKIGCSFTDRKTELRIEQARGMIMKLNADMDTDRVEYAINMESGQRYMACGLPADFQKEGLSVIFSGDRKQIFPNERWMATPFELKDIRMAN